MPRQSSKPAIASLSTPDGLICDFVGGAVGHRFRSGFGKNDALPRAAGFGKGSLPRVVDATAGLGRDSFLLACLGAEVTLIERSPHMQDLLADGMARAVAAGGATAEVMGRMKLLRGDSRVLLPGLDADVVVVDPMHPPRSKSALVKKEMRLVRELVGSDDDLIELMQVALGVAKKRVVLKWPLRAQPLAGIRAPSHQIRGKTTRYDVFMIG